MDLFRKKSVEQLVSESTPLKRTLKTFDLTMLGIGAIIGTGIFVLILGLNWETWLRFAVWFALGLLVYFTYSRKRSKLNGPELLASEV